MCARLNTWIEFNEIPVKVKDKTYKIEGEAWVLGHIDVSVSKADVEYGDNLVDVEPCYNTYEPVEPTGVELYSAIDTETNTYLDWDSLMDLEIYIDDHMSDYEDIIFSNLKVKDVDIDVNDIELEPEDTAHLRRW